MFWIIWGVVSFWALRTFYYSFTDEKFEGLRRTILGIDLSVLVLFFLPWLHLHQSAVTGWELIPRGNLSVAVLLVLTATASLLFLMKSSNLLKTGALLHITTSVLFIAVITRLMPGTFSLTKNSIAPIIASLLLLIGNVVVLLLWQQLELKTGKKK